MGLLICHSQYGYSQFTHFTLSSVYTFYCHHLISFAQISESILCIRIIFVLVGMQLFRQIPICLLNLVCVGISGHAENFIKIASTNTSKFEHTCHIGAIHKHFTQYSPNSTWLIMSRLDMTQHERDERACRAVLNMADGEQAIVLACTSCRFYAFTYTNPICSVK